MGSKHMNAGVVAIMSAWLKPVYLNLSGYLAIISVWTTAFPVINLITCITVRSVAP